MNPSERSSDPQGSIRITLKVFGGLRQMRESPVEQRPVRAGSTIDDLWTQMAVDAPDFVDKLREGVASGYLHVLVNGRNVVFLDGAKTRLHEGDTVAVLPPIGGG